VTEHPCDLRVFVSLCVVRGFEVVDFCIEDRIEFANELLGFGEGLVDRDETDVRDLVDVAQPLRDEFADETRRDDARLSILQRALDVVDETRHCRLGYVTLLYGSFDPCAKLRTVEWLDGSVALLHLEGVPFRTFVGRKAERTALTLAAPSDGGSIRAGLGIDDACSLVPAVRAVHRCH